MNTPTRRRPEGRPFRPGQSGNPGGRPRVVAELRDLARAHAPEALDTLVAVMRDPDASPAARIAAAGMILDRAWGKPTQAVEHSGPDGRPVPVTTLSADAVALLERLRGALQEAQADAQNSGEAGARRAPARLRGAAGHG